MFNKEKTFNIFALCLCCGLISLLPVIVGLSVSVSEVKSKSFVVNFAPISNASRYELRIALRHNSTASNIVYENYTSGKTISRLRPDTLYKVSVKAEDIEGRLEDDNNLTVSHTLPAPPKLNIKTALPNSAFVFFVGKNYAQVSQWMLEYQEQGKDSTRKTNVTTNGYVHWVSDLTANTHYQIRARVSQIREVLSVAEAEVEYSEWQNFTTARLSIFGRVDLANVSYDEVMQRSTENSTGWANSLQILQGAYTSISSDQINIIRIEDGDGKARVHYRIRVGDKTLPSKTNYFLNGAKFNNSFINNGDIGLGTPYAFYAARYTLVYSSSEANTCNKLVERYFIVTSEDQPTAEEHLNVASSDATTADEDDSLVIRPSGDHYTLSRDDGKPGKTIDRVSQNIVVALTPRFLVKDCLRNQSHVPLYSEFLYATNAETLTENINYYMITTNSTASAWRLEEAVIASSKIWSHFILYVKAVDKVTKYEILNNGTVLATLNREDLDSSDVWEINISGVSLTVNYTLSPRITFQKHDREIYFKNNTADIIANLGGTQCDVCSDSAICLTRNIAAAEVDCECLAGFQGDGKTCTPIPEPTTAVTTLAETTSEQRTTMIADTTLPSTVFVTTDVSEATTTDYSVETETGQTVPETHRMASEEVARNTTTDALTTTVDSDNNQHVEGYVDLLWILLAIAIAIVLCLLVLLAIRLYKKRKTGLHNISYGKRDVMLQEQQQQQNEAENSAEKETDCVTV